MDERLPNIDTIRLITTLDCNLSCAYCCNKLESVYSRFIKKTLAEIDFAKYKNVCLTGGEPFLYKFELYEIMREIPRSKNVYVYTNGLLIDWVDINILQGFRRLKGINIGLHSINQLEKLDRDIDILPVRYMVRDVYMPTLLRIYPKRLTAQNLKGWHLNICDQPNEDWILLQH